MLITNLEQEQWTVESGPTINPAVPESFNIIKTASGLRLYISSTEPYAGALAKHILPFIPLNTGLLTLEYDMEIDSGTFVCGQVIETDMKVTDANGWTYDGSFQIVLARNWIMQINNPWEDTGCYAKLNVGIHAVKIAYKLDYVNKNITVVGANVDGSMCPFVLPAIPAKQVGWAKNQVITQLQLCTASKGGAYSVEFSNIGHSFV